MTWARAAVWVVRTWVALVGRLLGASGMEVGDGVKWRSSDLRCRFAGVLEEALRMVSSEGGVDNPSSIDDRFRFDR